MTRYTIKDLRADVAEANRALLDAPKPGSYFYTIGQTYERTQLYASRIEPNGNTCQAYQIESGTSRKCAASVAESPLGGYRHPHTRINRKQAAGMLQACSDILTHDSSHTANSRDMDAVVNMARACHYRKPAKAPGSMGRMFFESAQRALRKKTKQSPWER